MCLNVPRRGKTGDNYLAEGNGFFSQLFVLWALPLMWKGRKGNIGMDDIPELNSDMLSTELYDRLDITWTQEK